MRIINPAKLSLVSASEPEDDAPLWSSVTNYRTGDRVIRQHAVYVSSIDDNQGNDPALENQDLEGLRWVYGGATNIHAFFEGKLATKTSGGSPLVLEVRVDAPFNAIALFNVECRHCAVDVITGGHTVRVAEFRSGPVPVSNWLDWLRTDFYKGVRRAVFDQGFSGAAESNVRLTLTGENPSIGELIVGRSVTIGITLEDSRTSVRPRTFTELKSNAFGVYDAVKRNGARDVSYYVRARRDGFSSVERFLGDIDGIKVVSYARGPRSHEFINYGFVTDYEICAGDTGDFFFQIKTHGVT